MAQEIPAIEAKEKTPTYDLLKDDVDVEKIDDVKIDDEKLDLEEKKEEKLELKEEKKEEEEEPKIDDDELTTQLGVLKRKEILAKYPNLFKEFPHLESSFYKAQKFYELFPSIDDAKELVERVKTFDEFEQQITKGNTESLLKTIKDSDNEAFGRIVDNYLPNLMKVDQGAYYHVIGNVLKSTIIAMIKEGKARDIEDLEKAGVILNQFVFQDSEFKPITKFGPDDKPEVDEKNKKFEEERAAYMEERFNDSRSDLDSRVTNIIKSTINQYIDPKGAMTDYVKNVAVREVLENLDNMITEDAQFKTVIDRLWQKAAEDNFSKPSIERIKTAWLNKAKTHLKDLIQTSRNNALKGLGKRADVDRSGPIAKGNPARERENTEGPKKGEKTVDFFMRD